jgi:hypothetical protein
MLHPSYRLRYFEESWKGSLAKYLGPVKKLRRRKLTDRYEEYAKGNRLRNKPENVFKWWDSQTDYPSLRQMAFDCLSIPAMPSECEQVFSGTKHTISGARCRLGANIIEAIQCKGRWMQAGIGDTVGPLFRYMTEQGLRGRGTLGSPRVDHRASKASD